MKNYTKIPFSEIKDTESYVEKVLKAGYIVIRILVDEDDQQIAEVASYANDKECKSHFKYLTDSKEQLSTSVIVETLQPYYAFKDPDRDQSTDDIDIEAERQDIFEFQTVKKEFRDMEEYFSGESFKYPDYPDDITMHYEFYISLEKGDIANFGGCLEIDFVTEWMEEQGYYSK